MRWFALLTEWLAVFLAGHTPSGAPEGRVSAKGIHDLSGCVGEASLDSLASISNWATLKVPGQRLQAQIGVVEDPLQSHSRCRCLAHELLGSSGGLAWVYRNYVQTICGLGQGIPSYRHGFARIRECADAWLLGAQTNTTGHGASSLPPHIEDPGELNSPSSGPQ